MDEIPEFNYIDLHINEVKLINDLITREDNTIEYNLFSNLLSAPIGFDEYMEYNGFYIGKNILREELGFEKIRSLATLTFL